MIHSASPTPRTPIVQVDPLSRAEDLLAALAPNDPRWLNSANDWIFRGQLDFPGGLVPSSLRPGKLRSYDPFQTPLGAGAGPIDIMFAEWTAIHDFIVAADRAGLSIPEDSQQLRSIQRPVGPPVGLKSSIIETVRNGSPVWPPDYLLSVFALAQHYGVPTRLLDWTWKPRVAAYFACNQAAKNMVPNPPPKLAVWAVRADFINTSWERTKPGIRLVTAPQATNPNLHAQAGLMTVDSDVGNPLPLDEAVRQRVAAVVTPFPPACFPFMWKLTLPTTEAPRLLGLLALEHIHAATIFPGHKGVVEALEERWFGRL